jgi:hypothetical protein
MIIHLFAEQAADAAPKKKSEEKGKKQPKEATSGSSESQDPNVALDPTVEANRMAEQLLAVRIVQEMGDFSFDSLLFFIA